MQAWEDKSIYEEIEQKLKWLTKEKRRKLKIRIERKNRVAEHCYLEGILEEGRKMPKQKNRPIIELF